MSDHFTLTPWLNYLESLSLTGKDSIDPVLKGLNNFDVKDYIAPVSGELRNFVVQVFSVQGLSFFGPEFMTQHTSLYGGMNHDAYFVILRELYDTIQRSTMLQYDIEALYNEITFYFSGVFLGNLLDNYQDTTNSFQDTFNNFAGDRDSSARFEHLSELNQQLMNFLNMYRSNLTRTASLLEQVQRINPGFTLHTPPDNVTIDVTPIPWFVIETFNPDFDWNPELFNFETLGWPDHATIRLVGNTSFSGPDFWEIVTAFNTQSNRQTRTITYSFGESPDVFNTERNNPLSRSGAVQSSSNNQETESDRGENSADEETNPAKRERSEDEETNPAKKKRSEDEDTEPDKGENSADV